MEELRIIKKYPNRRLYDTAVSRYITLEEVKELVIKNIKFKIVDARTDEDMTNYVLLQIISEHEGGNSPIFTTAILQNIIRFYGNPLQKVLKQFLEQSFSQFNEKQAEVKITYDTLAELAKQNIAKWQSAFEEMFAHNVKPKPKKSKREKS